MPYFNLTRSILYTIGSAKNHKKNAEDEAWTTSNGSPEIIAAANAPAVISAWDCTTYEKFMISPYKTSVTIKP